MNGRGSSCDRSLVHRAIWMIGVYFLLHLVLRVVVSANVELDEAEQVLLSQNFAWGYGSQPPLYTWLQMMLFRLFGENVFSLALLKNGLLFLLYLFTFLSAREISGEDRPAVAAMLSLLFIPQIVWESQRDLTHSVLVTAMMAGTLFAGLRLCRRGRTFDYLLFATFAGLGILSKYNFVVALVAFILAAGSLPQYRERLARPRILLALGVFVLIAGPHIFWAVTHVETLLHQSGSLGISTASSPWLNRIQGVFSLLEAVFSFLAPLVVIYALLFIRRTFRWQKPWQQNPLGMLLERKLLIGILLCLVVVLLFGVTGLKARWMQPLLFSAGIYLSLVLHTEIQKKGLRRLVITAAAVAVLILTMLPMRTLLASRFEGQNDLNAPFDTLSEALRQAGFTEGNIVAGNRWVGGNLRLRFPHSSVVVPELTTSQFLSADSWLIAWDADRSREIPAGLAQLCEKLSDCRLEGVPEYIEVPGLYGDAPMRLGYLIQGGR